MYYSEIPDTIIRMTAVFYRLGMWDSTENRTYRVVTLGLKLFHFVYYAMFVVSVALGAFITNDSDEFVFLMCVTTVVALHVFRMFHIMWKKEEILSLIHQVGIHSANNEQELFLVQKKLLAFVKFAKYFIVMCGIGVFFIAIFPVLSRGKLLIFNIAFPFDRKNSVVAFWLANAFITSGGIYSILCFLLSIIIWYLLINVAIKYEILGNQLRNLCVSTVKGSTTVTKQKRSNIEQRQIFPKNLIVAIKTHQKIQEYKLYRTYQKILNNL